MKKTTPPRWLTDSAALAPTSPLLPSASLHALPEELDKTQHWGAAWLERLRAERVVAVIQAPTVRAGLAMAGLAVSAGIRLLEVTLTSDRPFFLVEQLRQRWPDCQVGVGTVLSVNQFEEAIAAGAQFGFSPVSDARILELAFRSSIPFMAGALTPNEIWQAWQSGATAVKVFPASALGGPRYLRNLRAPLGQIPLVPTGGLTLENATEFIEAGATAVCLGGALFPRQLVAERQWSAIAQRAAGLMERLRACQSQLAYGRTNELGCPSEPDVLRDDSEIRL